VPIIHEVGGFHGVSLSARCKRAKHREKKEPQLVSASLCRRRLKYGRDDRFTLEAIMLALRLVALALGAFRPFSQVFDLTSGPIVQGWVA
jgi:hypothetical protein